MPYRSRRMTMRGQASRRSKAPQRTKYGQKLNKINVYQPRYMKDSAVTRAPTIKSDQGMSNGFIPAFARQRYWGKVRYGASGIALNSSVGNVGTYVYSANGLTDPSITGGTTQPGGFAQLISSYEHYTCWRSKITVIFTNNNASACIVGIALEPDGTASTVPDNMLELPNEQVVQLEPQGQYGSSKTLSMTASLSKFFGESVTKATSLYRGDATNNPQEQAYFHCKVYGAKLENAGVIMQVRIEYEALWTEPRELTASLNRAIMDLIIDEKETKEQETLPAQINIPPVLVPDYTPRQRR